MLEVKGDFCHAVRGILEDAGRGDDYVEIGLDGSWQWNPLDDPLLDTYSLAYTVSSLINQLFGKSREPFWQQAYTNLVRWIIELHRLLPGGWVTLRDVYRCTIDAELFARKIGQARELAARLCPVRVSIASSDLVTHQESLEDWAWEPVPDGQTATCLLGPGLRDRLGELGVAYETEAAGAGPGASFGSRSRRSSGGTGTTGRRSMPSSAPRSSRASASSCRCSTSRRSPACSARRLRSRMSPHLYI